MGILDRFLGAKRVKRGAAFYQLSVSAVPDKPQLFGYKNSWLAIRSDSPEKVMAALELEPVAKANWATGLPYAGEGKLVYVSPCLDGFVLVVGYWEWTENRAKLDRIAKEFDEVQAFATHRVSETHAWMLYRNHQPVRGYFYADGQVEWEIGDLTWASTPSRTRGRTIPTTSPMRRRCWKSPPPGESTPFSKKRSILRPWAWSAPEAIPSRNREGTP